ncbi:hypothetical protein SUGI_0294280 [Cryptomeria japonica]|uniref:cytochrome P450 716B2-like n=1 Tax=Cryptomeria japonica TaxID=3369 RepID=UPI00240898CB|nr:cytochrome P450 716B2-like [Cryptomeria japonica]GLJ17009.1 hypothetical protein SUGI_0294280 [Cryptomeria japonica]
MDILTREALIIGTTFVLRYFIIRKLASSKASSNLPPGSFGWPLVGEMPQLLLSAKINSLQDFFEWGVKRYGGDIFKTFIFGHRTAIFYSAEGNRFLFNNRNKLFQSYWPDSVKLLFGNSIFSKVGEEANGVRKMLMTFLKPQALQKFMGRVDAIVNNHINSKWFEKQQIEAFPLIRHCMFVVACNLFLSLDNDNDITELYSYFTDLVKGMTQIPLDLPGMPYHKAMSAGRHLRRILQKLIQRKRNDLASGSASGEQDLLSFLLCNVDEQGNTLTDEEIKDNIMLLLVQDTSVVTLAFLLRNLDLNPHCYTQVHKEQMEISRAIEGRELKWDDIQKMKYSWRATQETLRLDPPALGSWRKCVADISYGGYTIPKGWKVCWITFSTHKNPKHFPDPQKFDPSRFEGSGPPPYIFVPFGGGPRMCPGNEYARMVILVFLHNIAKRFEWSLVDANEIIVADPTPRPTRGLPLNLRPHSNQ